MKQNKYIYLLYILLFSLVVKPDWLIPQLNSIHFFTPVFSLILTVLALSKNNFKSYSNNYLGIFLFLLIMIISGLMARNIGVARDVVKSFAYICLFILPISLLISSFDNYKKVFNFFYISMIILAIKGILEGGLIKNIPTLADQNEYSLILNMMIPFAFFNIFRSTKTSLKIIHVIVLIILLYGTILSNSRGGFIGLIAVSIYCWYKYPHKLKATLIVIFAIFVFIIIAPKSFWVEMETIFLGMEEATALTRLNFWKMAIKMFIKNPIWGVGPGNYGVVLPDVIPKDNPLWGYRAETMYGWVPHSIIFTIIAESGIVGIVIFSYICVRFFKNNIYSLLLFKEMYNKETELDNYNILYMENIIRSLNGSFIGFFVSGLFISVIYYEWFWIIVALNIGLINVIIKKYKEFNYGKVN